jgi:hypothetical protein
VLDIGAAEGWFVRRAASDLGCFAIGVEASDRGILGELSRLHDRVERTATLRALVTAEELRAWPKFDAVICMSVVHHIARAHGLAQAEAFVASCASRAAKVLIFEMGTADEASWERTLPDMAQGQEQFVCALLGRCGLTNVRVIAETDAYQKGATRLLFAAEPVVPSADGVEPRQRPSADARI